MAFDIEMIKKLYPEMPAKVNAARTALGRPLTLSEKILFAHCYLIRFCASKLILQSFLSIWSKM